MAKNIPSGAAAAAAGVLQRIQATVVGTETERTMEVQEQDEDENGWGQEDNLDVLLDGNEDDAGRKSKTRMNEIALHAENGNSGSNGSTESAVDRRSRSSSSSATTATTTTTSSSSFVQPSASFARTFTTSFTDAVTRLAEIAAPVPAASSTDNKANKNSSSNSNDDNNKKNEVHSDEEGDEKEEEEEKEASISQSASIDRLQRQLNRVTSALTKATEEAKSENMRAEAFRTHAVELQEKTDILVHDREAIEGEWQERIMAMQTEWKARDKTHIETILHLRDQESLLQAKVELETKEREEAESKVATLQTTIEEERERADDAKRALERERIANAAASREAPMDETVMNETLATAEKYKRQANEAMTRLREAMDEVEALRVTAAAIKNDPTEDRKTMEKIEKLEQTNERLEKQVTEFQSRVEELETAVAIAEEAVADADNEKLDSRQRLAALQSQLEGSDDALRRAVSTCEEAVKAREESESRYKTLETDSASKVSHLEGELSRLRSDLEAARSGSDDALRRAVSTCEEAVKAREESEAARFVAEEKVSELNIATTHQIESLRKRISSFEEQVSSLQTSLETAHEDVRKFQAVAVAAAASAQENLQTQIKEANALHAAAFEKEQATSASKLSELQTLLAETRTELSLAQQQIETARASATEAVERRLHANHLLLLSSAEERITKELSEKYEAEKELLLLREKEEASSLVAFATKSLEENAAAAAAHAAHQLAELQGTIKQLQSEKATIEMQKQDMQVHLDTYVQKLQDSVAETKAYRLQLDNHNAAMSQQETESVLQARAATARAQEDASLARTELRTLRTSLTESIEAYQRLQSSFDRLQADFRSSYAREELAETSAQRSSARIHELEDICDSLRRSLDASIKKQMELEDTLAKARETSNAMMERLQEAEEQYHATSNGSLEVQHDLDDANARIADLQVHLRAFEDSAASERDAARDREASLVSSLTAAEAQLQLASSAHEEALRLRADLQVRDTELATAQSSLDNLQLALEGLQAAKAAVEARELANEKEKVILQGRVQELLMMMKGTTATGGLGGGVGVGGSSTTSLSSTSPLSSPSSSSSAAAAENAASKQLAQAHVRIAHLQQTTHELRSALEDAKRTAFDGNSASVDRRLVAQLLVAFFTAQRDGGGDISFSSSRAKDSLSITANILGMEQRDRDALGLFISGKGGDSSADADAAAGNQGEAGVTASAVKAVGSLLSGLWGSSSSVRDDRDSSSGGGSGMRTPSSKGHKNNNMTVVTKSTNNNDTLGAAFVQFLLSETAEDGEEEEDDNSTMVSMVEGDIPQSATKASSPITSPLRTV